MSVAYIGEYLAKAIADWVYRDVTAITRPTSTRVRLHTGDPGRLGTANEVSTSVWTNYAYEIVYVDGLTSPYWNLPQYDNGVVLWDNNGEIDFGTATVVGPPFVCSHITITDENDNLLNQGAISKPVTISDGKRIRIPSGGFDLVIPVEIP